MWLDVKADDQATPTLNDLREALKPGSGEHIRMLKTVGASVETLTRDHIRKAAPSRHKTANRLGATPTNYLAKRADTVESSVSGTLVMVAVYGAIFARVDGSKTVRARPKKALTIPATAAAYGRRAKEIGGLRLVVFLDAKKAALAKVKGGPKTGTVFMRKKIFGPAKLSTVRWQRWREKKGLSNDPPEIKVFYWLKKQVTLPQDRGLLPADAELLDAVEDGARAYLDDLEKDLAQPQG